MQPEIKTEFLRIRTIHERSAFIIIGRYEHLNSQKMMANQIQRFNSNNEKRRRGERKSVGVSREKEHKQNYLSRAPNQKYVPRSRGIPSYIKEGERSQS